MNITKLLKIGFKLTTIASFFFCPIAFALPQNGQVAQGAAIISQTPNQVVITQTTQNTVINWQSFNASSTESVLFNQPNASSIALNRITNGLPTQFAGQLSASGQVWILNPAGVLFTSTAKVDVAGFVATTHNITDQNFMMGNYKFDLVPGSENSKIINNGLITAKESGLVALVAPYVENNGVIVANLGRVNLSTGASYTLDLYGDNLINFGSNAPIDNGSVSNAGTIIANGGKVYMAANSAAKVVDNVVSMSGVIEATSVSTNQNGEIVLNGGSSGVTHVSGRLHASHVETSGRTLIIDPSATIVADNWLIDPANLTITNADSAVTLVSPFQPTATASTLNVATLTAALANGDVTVQTNNDIFAGSGDITVATAITWTSTHTLFLQSFHNIFINAPITGTNGSLNLSAINAANSITTNASGTINVANFNLIKGFWSQVSAVLPAFTVTTNFQLNSGNGLVGTVQFIRATSGDGSVGTPYVLTDIYGVEGIGSNATTLAQYFNLGSNIDASGTVNWNGGLGFVPIGTGTPSGIAYSKTFDGQNFTISNLFINRSAKTQVGLFAFTSAAAQVNNLILTGETITGLSEVGGLSGHNDGIINHVSVAGSVSGNSGLYTGGLVGVNNGTLSNSSVSVIVSSAGNGVGGIAGYNNGTINSSVVISNPASVTGTSANGFYAGGLVGFNNTSGVISSGLINPNFNAVTALTYTSVGGVVGFYSNATTVLTNVINNASVTGLTDVGGIVGTMAAGTTLNGNSANNGVVSGLGNGIGGIAGLNQGTILSPVTATGTVHGIGASGNEVGGLVGVNGSTGVVSGLTNPSSNAVTALNYSDVGGITGINFNVMLSNDTNLASVTGASVVAGIVGFLEPSATVDNAINSGTIHGSGTYVGGIIGWSDGTVSNSHSSGNISASVNAAGGLIGQNNFVITSSYATGNVSANHYSGGLAGWNNGTIDNSYYAGGTVTGIPGGIAIGGIAGYNRGTIENTGLPILNIVSGAVNASASSYVGGIVGWNDGNVGTALSNTISSSANVTGLSYVGGIVGGNFGLDTGSAFITNATATGTVTGTTYVGGVVGSNGYVPAPVAGPMEVTNAHYSNTTTPISGTNFVGGIIGYNAIDGILDSASTVDAKVTGSGSDIGGMIGYNNAPISAPVISYVTSNVTVTGTGSGNYVGGLIGFNDIAGSLTGLVAPSTDIVTALTDNNIGGLVGVNKGSIANSSAMNNVTGGGAVGGLIGEMISGSLTGTDYATGNVFGSGNTIGGLIGYNNVAITPIAQNMIYATGTVNGTGPVLGFIVGGLIGENDAAGVLTNLSSSNTVSAANYTWVGGLVGENNGSITHSTVINANVTGDSDTGGVIGYATAISTQSNLSTVDGSITAVSNVGGVVGRLFGTLSDSFNSGATVTGGNGGIGGLVGSINSTGAITGNSYSTGNVFGIDDVGSLVGYNDGTITPPAFGIIYATGTVNGTGPAGSTSIGGVVGYNDIHGALQYLNNFYPVNAPNYNGVGGIVGTNAGSVSFVYNIYAVTGGTNVGGIAGNSIGGNVNTVYNSAIITAAGSAGGLIGAMSNATLNNAYNTGNVFNDGIQTNPNGFGGVIGSSGINNTLTNLYNSGYISGNMNGQSGINVGGLMGSANLNGNTIGFLYNIGYVVGSANTGGLIGNVVSGTPLFSGTTYWNTDTSGQSVGVSNFSDANIIGATTAQMDKQATYTTTPSNWDFSSTWAIVENQSYPYLLSFYPTTPRFITSTSNIAPGGTDINLYINGSATPFDTFSGGANGAGYFLEGVNALSGIDHTVLDNSLVFMKLGNSPILSNAIAIIPNGGGQAGITNGLFLDNNTVTVGLASAANSQEINNLTLLDAQGAITGGILFSLSGNDLSANSGINFTTTLPTTYTSIGNITTTNGNILMGGPVLLDVNSIYTTTVSNTITFVTGGDGPAGLLVNSHLFLEGDFGLNTPLAYLTVSGQSTFSGSTIISSGNQMYLNTVNLVNPTEMITVGGGGVRFEFGSAGVVGPTSLTVITNYPTTGINDTGITGTVSVDSFMMGGTGGGNISPVTVDSFVPQTQGGAQAWFDTFVLPNATGYYCVNNFCSFNGMQLNNIPPTEIFSNPEQPNDCTAGGCGNVEVVTGKNYCEYSRIDFDDNYYGYENKLDRHHLYRSLLYKQEQDCNCREDYRKIYNDKYVNEEHYKDKFAHYCRAHKNLVDLTVYRHSGVAALKPIVVKFHEGNKRISWEHYAVTKRDMYFR